MSRLLVLAAALTITTPPANEPAKSPPRLVEANEVKELVAQQRGRVVLLNFWATWCPPCLVEFPEIVEIEKTYRERGLAVVSVSADSADRIESDLIPFLAKHAPEFPIYVMRTDDLDTFMQRIDPEWTGEVPATFFISRGGDVTFKRFGAMSRAQLEQALDYTFDEPEP